MEAAEVKKARYLTDAKARARADETASDTDGSAVKIVTPNRYKNKTALKRDESSMPPGLWNLTHNMEGGMASQWTKRQCGRARKETQTRPGGAGRRTWGETPKLLGSRHLGCCHQQGK